VGLRELMLEKEMQWRVTPENPSCGQVNSDSLLQLRRTKTIFPELWKD